MSGQPEATLRRLVAAIDGYLIAHPFPGLAEVQAGLAGAEGTLFRSLAPSPPPCGHLEKAVAAIVGADELKAAISAALPFLSWVTYDVYPRAEIGGRFPKAHAFASLIGDGSPFQAEDFDLGLFLIAPHINYRDRHHAAPEIYAPLTGPHRWRFGVNDPWIDLPAHQPVWNEPWAVHATITGETPFLCLFCWTRDVNRPAKVVYASDWDMIEASL